MQHTFKLDHAQKRLLMGEAERAREEQTVRTREALEQAEARATALERRLADAIQRAEFDGRDHAATLKALKEEHACSLRELEHEKLLALESKQQVQQSMLELELAKNEEISALKQRLLTLQSELAVLHAEREGFDAARAELKAEAEAARADMDAKVRESHELQLEYEQLQNKHRALGEKEHALQAAFDKLSLEAESLRGEVGATTGALDEERKQFVREVTAAKSAHRHDKTLLLARLDEIAKGAQAAEERRAKELSEARTDKNKYKKISLSLKQKLSDILRSVKACTHDSSFMRVDCGWES